MHGDTGVALPSENNIKRLRHKKQFPRALRMPVRFMEDELGVLFSPDRSWNSKSEEEMV